MVLKKLKAYCFLARAISTKQREALTSSEPGQLELAFNVSQAILGREPNTLYVDFFTMQDKQRR
jgi:hypothetical protein